MKLLLVDNEKYYASDINKYLIKEGYLIEIAPTYNQGEEKLLVPSQKSIWDKNELCVMPKLNKVEPIY